MPPIAPDTRSMIHAIQRNGAASHPNNQPKNSHIDRHREEAVENGADGMNDRGNEQNEALDQPGRKADAGEGNGRSVQQIERQYRKHHEKQDRVQGFPRSLRREQGHKQRQRTAGTRDWAASAARSDRSHRSTGRTSPSHRPSRRQAACPPRLRRCSLRGSRQ